MIDFGGEHLARAGLGGGDRDQPRPRSEIEHGAAGDDFGPVKQIPGERLPAGPGESPEWWRHPAARQALLGRLPDRGHLGREVQSDLGHQRRCGDRSVAADKFHWVHCRSGQVSADDAGEQEPADKPIGPEFGEAIRRIFDVDERCLPSELHHYER